MRYIFLFTLALVTAVASAQHKKSPPPPPGPPTAEDNLRNEIHDQCLYINKYNSIQRRNIYPFKDAAKVMLISFKESEYLTDEGTIPVHKKVLDRGKVLEQVVLNDKQIDSLTSILYNIGFTPIELSLIETGEAKCYNPRNGIVFIDSAGKASEYIEICFECHRTRVSSKKVKQGDFCATKIELLRSFFANVGLKYGVQDEDHRIFTYHEILTPDTRNVDTLHFTAALARKLDHKTNSGKNTNTLTSTERTLFYALNGEKIYNGYSWLSGFGYFYLNSCGDYYQETINALSEIGAKLLANTLKNSEKQWPKGTVPKDLVTRRKILLKIFNRADREWQKLTDSLYNCKETIGALECEMKEDLNTLIFDYANQHKRELTD